MVKTAVPSPRERLPLSLIPPAGTIAAASGLAAQWEALALLRGITASGERLRILLLVKQSDRTGRFDSSGALAPSVAVRSLANSWFRSVAERLRGAEKFGQW